MKSVCVFCGSNKGELPDYENTARQLGEMLADQKLSLVYGGSRMGLMGAVADACLQAGGNVVGVIPKLLIEKEIAHANLNHLEVVGTMHERKQKMYDLSDAFIALPGGFGTLDELCEIITWGQLQVHSKPSAILNVANYYDPLLEQIRTATKQGFIKKEVFDDLIISTDPAQILERCRQAPAAEDRISSELL